MRGISRPGTSHDHCCGSMPPTRMSAARSSLRVGPRWRTAMFGRPGGSGIQHRSGDHRAAVTRAATAVRLPDMVLDAATSAAAPSDQTALPHRRAARRHDPLRRMAGIGVRHHRLDRRRCGPRRHTLPGRRPCPGNRPSGVIATLAARQVHRNLVPHVRHGDVLVTDVLDSAPIPLRSAVRTLESAPE